MKLEQFYSLLSRNAKVTITDRKGKAYYTGALKAIPDEYNDSTVEDFKMANDGSVTFRIKAPAKRKDAADRNWSMGMITVPDPNNSAKSTYCHYWVKHFDEPSEDFGIDGGRISKLMIKVDGKVTANYDRGWDVEPEDEATEMAVAILMNNYH